jgi:hypothetical protein
MDIDNADIRAEISGAMSKTGLEGVTSSMTFSVLEQQAFTDGTDTEEVNQMWSDGSDDMAASGTVTYDLAGGISDAYGDTVTFTKIKAILVRNESDGTVEIEIGGAAANQWYPMFDNANDIEKIAAGGCWFHYNPEGWAVTAGTGDNFMIANNDSGSTASYSIMVIGIV